MRGLGKAQARKQVQDLAKLLQIEPLLERRPRELSGGQRQRVASGTVQNWGDGDGNGMTCHAEAGLEGVNGVGAGGRDGR